MSTRGSGCSGMFPRTWESSPAASLACWLSPRSSPSRSGVWVRRGSLLRSSPRVPCGQLAETVGLGIQGVVEAGGHVLQRNDGRQLDDGPRREAAAQAGHEVVADRGRRGGDGFSVFQRQPLYSSASRSSAVKASEARHRETCSSTGISCVAPSAAAFRSMQNAQSTTCETRTDASARRRIGNGERARRNRPNKPRKPSKAAGRQDHRAVGSSTAPCRRRCHHHKGRMNQAGGAAGSLMDDSKPARA